MQLAYRFCDCILPLPFTICLHIFPCDDAICCTPSLDERLKRFAVENDYTGTCLDKALGWAVGVGAPYLLAARAAARCESCCTTAGVTNTANIWQHVAKICRFLAARSLLYRSRSLQVNMRFAAFFKLDKICTLLTAPNSTF